MCFSATASFSAATLLGAIGAASVARAPSKRALPFAAIPPLFAAQQAIEGGIWLSFEGDARAWNAALTFAYAFCSHVLWPTWIPLAVLLIEPQPGRRKALRVLLGIGVSLSLWLAWLMVSAGVVSRTTGHHVEYVSSSVLAVASTACYVLSVAASLSLSSLPWVRVFGVLALASFAAAWLLYAEWLVSVWCFFAALLSSVVLVHVRAEAQRRRGSGPSAGSRLSGA